MYTVCVSQQENAWVTWRIGCGDNTQFVSHLGACVCVLLQFRAQFVSILRRSFRFGCVHQRAHLWARWQDVSIGPSSQVFLAKSFGSQFQSPRVRNSETKGAEQKNSNTKKAPSRRCCWEMSVGVKMDDHRVDDEYGLTCSKCNSKKKVLCGL